MACDSDAVLSAIVAANYYEEQKNGAMRLTEIVGNYYVIPVLSCPRVDFNAKLDVLLLIHMSNIDLTKLLFL